MDEPDKEPDSVQQQPRTCPVCGTKFFATAGREFCPVCILRRAFGTESKATGEAGSVSGSAESPRETEGASKPRRFDQYEVMLDEGGRPIELGRGAMGVTFKALNSKNHINCCCSRIRPKEGPFRPNPSSRSLPERRHSYLLLDIAALS
jgi:uncharacterized Zn finger protein (UPF0148 family)